MIGDDCKNLSGIYSSELLFVLNNDAISFKLSLIDSRDLLVFIKIVLFLPFIASARSYAGLLPECI